MAFTFSGGLGVDPRLGIPKQFPPESPFVALRHSRLDHRHFVACSRTSYRSLWVDIPRDQSDLYLFAVVLAIIL